MRLDFIIKKRKLQAAVQEVKKFKGPNLYIVLLDH